jgi:hypothetical protein
MSTVGDLPTMKGWRSISNRRIRRGFRRRSGSLDTACSGRCPAITHTCTWSRMDRAAPRHTNVLRARRSVARRRDHEPECVQAGKGVIKIDSLRMVERYAHVDDGSWPAVRVHATTREAARRGTQEGPQRIERRPSILTRGWPELVVSSAVASSESPSSRGPGRGPFKAKTRVRIPLGTYHLVQPTPSQTVR